MWPGKLNNKILSTFCNYIYQPLSAFTVVFSFIPASCGRNCALNSCSFSIYISGHFHSLSCSSSPSSSLTFIFIPFFSTLSFPSKCKSANISHSKDKEKKVSLFKNWSTVDLQYHVSLPDHRKQTKVTKGKGEGDGQKNPLFVPSCFTYCLVNSSSFSCPLTVQALSSPLHSQTSRNNCLHLMFLLIQLPL